MMVGRFSPCDDCKRWYERGRGNFTQFEPMRNDKWTKWVCRDCADKRLANGRVPVRLMSYRYMDAKFEELGLLVVEAMFGVTTIVGGLAANWWVFGVSIVFMVFALILNLCAGQRAEQTKAGDSGAVHSRR